jgi:hypothetical protein
MEFGTLIHQLVLGGDRVAVLDYPDWRTNAAKADRAALRADGRTPILWKQLNAVSPIVEAVRLAVRGEFDLDISDFVCEERIAWPYGGIECEGTPDAYRVRDGAALMWDLKTTKKLPGLDALGRKAAGDGWALQRTAYLSALETLYPEVAGRIDWRWVVAETEPPYAVRIVSADSSLEELGRLRWEFSVVRWKQLLDLGWMEPWPVGAKGDRIEAPPYELTRAQIALDDMIGAEE